MFFCSSFRITLQKMMRMTNWAFKLAYRVNYAFFNLHFFGHPFTSKSSIASEYPHSGQTSQSSGTWASQFGQTQQESLLTQNPPLFV